LIMGQNFKISAIWDSSLGVFVSESDIPGLVIETESFEEFVAMVEALAPDLIEANLPESLRPFVLEIQVFRVLEIK
jgi:Domain of unknown function (DUF1902)